MKSIFTCILMLLICSTNMSAQQPLTIVVHGGAGTILKKNLSEEKEKAIRSALSEALEAGYSILQAGGTSLDAVKAAVVVMEDSPLFNAGRGAVYNHESSQEMDAAIMDGETLEAGAVAGVSLVKNPILLASKVLTDSEHVMLAGAGAEEFAKSNNIEFAKPEYFRNERRMRQLQRAKEQEKIMLDHDGDRGEVFPDEFEDDDKKYGTVGAVALDKDGNIAAATSTGGMTNKRYNRIGDSPIIGSGTYANNQQCGVSCTGHGEFFMRAVVAYDVFSMMEYKGLSLQEAAQEVVQKK